MNTTHRFGALTQSHGGMDLGTPDGLIARLLRPTFLFPEDDGAGGGQGGAGGSGGQQQEWKAPADQAELNRIIEERLARDRRERPSDDEVAELRRKARAHDETVAADQTDLQRTQTELATAQENERKAIERGNNIARRAALVAAASKARAVDPDVVADLVLARNQNAVTIDDAGQVTGADTAVSTLLSEQPYLASTTDVDSGQGRNRGGGEGKPSGLAAGRERREARNGPK